MGSNHCSPANSYMSAFYPHRVKHRLKGNILDHSGEENKDSVCECFLGHSDRCWPFSQEDSCHRFPDTNYCLNSLVCLESLSNHIFLEHKSPTFISRHGIEEHNPVFCYSQSWAFWTCFFWIWPMSKNSGYSSSKDKHNPQSDTFSACLCFWGKRWEDVFHWTHRHSHFQMECEAGWIGQAGRRW